MKQKRQYSFIHYMYNFMFSFSKWFSGMLEGTRRIEKKNKGRVIYYQLGGGAVIFGGGGVGFFFGDVLGGVKIK